MSRTPSSRSLSVVAVLAAASLALGAAVAVRPPLVERIPALGSRLADLEPRLVVLALLLLLLVFAPAVGLSSALRRRSVEPLGSALETDADAEREASDEGKRHPSVGEPFDRYVDLATAVDEPQELRSGARERLRDALRSTAATAYANRTGVAREDAAEAIEAGGWTTDPRAAAFLADDDGPSTPLRCWLYDLAIGADPYERGLERTIAEIESLQTGPRRDGDDRRGAVPEGVTA